MNSEPSFVALDVAGGSLSCPALVEVRGQPPTSPGASTTVALKQEALSGALLFSSSLRKTDLGFYELM